MQNARYMKDNLLAYGYKYVVCDIRWYCNHPSLGAGNYNQQGTQDYVLDEYGRYLPSPSRFPSGFKAIADSIHSMGLKFGIHIMRGVPKSVVGSSYKLLGSEDTPWTSVYASTTPACTWLQDNLTVQNNEYGQLYYNSIFDLYASWGVDFIKVDDLSRPFYADEIQMIRTAIDQCGRPIVLSLSPGKTAYEYAPQCNAMANQWRMMDDLWDNWSNVSAVFNEANAWSQYHQVGNYADCDMLPLGQIAMTIADNGYTSADAGRWTNLTEAEQTSLMTLWGICHSPLMMGGEMTKNDAFTLSLLTNEDMLLMNSYGQDAHQVQNDGSGQIVWTSLDPATGYRYLAMFQDDDTRWVYDSKALFKSENVTYTTDGHAVNVDISWPEGSKTLALVIDDGGDNYNYDHGDWLNPTLILSDNTEVPLTGDYLTRTYTDSYYNRVYENKNVMTEGTMTVMGQTYERGFSADANAMLLFTIPDDMDVVRFTALAAADDSGITQDGATTSICFMVFDQNPLMSESEEYAACSGLISRQGTKSCTLQCDITDAASLKIFVSNYGDGYTYDRADLINPVLIDADGGETSLTSLTPTSYTSQWGSLHTNENVEGGTLRVDGQSYTTGLGLNAECTLVYDLPSGHTYKTFRTLCGYDSSCDTDNTSTDGTTMEFFLYVTDQAGYSVDLQQFGYGEGQSVEVYDCWAGERGETVQGSLYADVPSHGARLFRLEPERTETSTVTLTLNEDSTMLLVTVTPYDSWQSYVQLLSDGEVIGNMSVGEDGKATYHLSDEWNAGTHVYQALYSGTPQTLPSKSAEVQLSLGDPSSNEEEGEEEDSGTGIDHVAADTNPINVPSPEAVYDLSGRRLSGDIHGLGAGLYIQGGVKVVKH